MLTTDEIRKRYLEFFISKGHKADHSDSLVPANDPSVLFTGAGMNQYKDHFAGVARLDHPQQRATTAQKCVRAGDIDNVGRTPSHHTFFEMLGNFSFGDYFKTEAIQWAVEFLTDPKVGLGLPKERLSVTVYKGDPTLKLERDDEAIAAWKRFAPFLQDPRANKGIEPGWRIYGYGEHDNFWPADAPSQGPNGPCGPCSEIYFDMLGWAEGRSPAELPPPEPVAEDGARYVEIWNLVFTQFDRRDGGLLKPLPARNIDTGAGLERMARVLQKKRSNFEIDLLMPIVTKAAEIAQADYGQDDEKDRRMRRIADHVRMGTMAIADGVAPENEGRNYVVRRLLRRAILDGKELGIERPFMSEVSQAVFAQMKVGYPEIEKRKTIVLRTIEEEERRFNKTLEQGRALLKETIRENLAQGRKELSGEEVFRLWDTFGFPAELTQEAAEAVGLSVDRAGYEDALEKAREISQAGTKMQAEIFATGPLAEVRRQFSGRATEFHGYSTLEVEDAEVLAIVQNEALVQKAGSGMAIVLLDETPFYGESGGQVGDKGSFVHQGHVFRVVDTQKMDGLYFHHVELNEAGLEVGDHVMARVEPAHRKPLIKNHSATHLLHLALRELLGAHVEQRGSLVTPDRLRFDFTHFEAMSPDALTRIELRVNELIQQDDEVICREKSLEEARRAGAMALFGEKYGSTVRVVQMGPSMELCGGTHCRRTGEIGSFRIVSESSSSAGIRRIEAVTGMLALQSAQESARRLMEVAGLLKVSPVALRERIETLLEEKAELQRQLDALKKKAANAMAGDLSAQAREIQGIKLLTARLEGQDAKGLRETLDSLRKSLPDAVFVLVGGDEGKLAVLVAASETPVKRGVHAGRILQAIAPLLGGKGGGKPELAQGGGTSLAKLNEAIALVESELTTMLK